MKPMQMKSVTEPAIDLVERVSEMTDAARERVGEVQRDMVRNLRRARRRGEDLLEDGRYEIKQHPVSAVTVTLVAGMTLGFALGLLLGTRR